MVQAKVALDSVDQVFNQTARARPECEHCSKVRITTPHVLGRRFVFVSQSAEHYAGISGYHVRCAVSDQVSNVVDEQIDIGVRVGFMQDNRFIARSVTKVRLMVVASPELLKRVGKPETPDDLINLPVTSLIDQSTGRC